MILRPHTTSVLQNICTHSGMRLASVLLPSAESEVTSASKAPSPILRPFLHRSTWRAEIESPFAVRKRELDKLDKPTLVSSSVLPFPTFGERIVIRNVMTYLEKQSFRWFYPKYKQNTGDCIKRHCLRPVRKSLQRLSCLGMEKHKSFQLVLLPISNPSSGDTKFEKE